MKRMWTTATIAVAVVAGGCSSGGGAPEPTEASPAAPTATPSPSATASDTPTPTPTPSPTDSRLKLGKSWADDFVKITVQKVAVNAKTDIDPYSGALVRACVLKNSPGTDVSAFSWSPWALIDAEGGRYPDNGTVYGYTPTPVFPNGEQDGTFQPGDCVKGWIFFDVPKGTKITEVRYQYEGLPEPAVWRVR